MSKNRSRKGISGYGIMASMIIVITAVIVIIGLGFNNWSIGRSNVLEVDGIELIEVKSNKSSLNSDNRALNSINNLAFEMVKKDEGNNLVISSVSLGSSLALLTNGANEEGKKELMRYMLPGKRLVEDNDTIQQMNKDFNEYILYMSNDGKKCDIEYGTSMWIDNQYSNEVNEEFIDRANNDFFAEVYFEDFKGDTERAINKVNRWCSRKTKGKIEEIMDKDLDDEFFGVILNTLYFKGPWQEPFNKRATRKKEFTTGEGEKIKVPMMQSKEDVEYLENEGYKAIKKAYGYGKYEMTIILPHENSGIEEIINDMDIEWWQEINNGENYFNYEDVILNIPKFKVEYDRLLNDDLINGGVESIFMRKPAGLSDIGEDVYLSLIKQKCTIEVSENGTEAAAATESEMDKSEACEEEKEPKEFIVNRPFIFIISDRKYDSILFIGKVYNPA
ncbi:serpin family protein [Oceanirhabdus seepicola]|uniref:Serpin domain-containing protein n=1 Tax=Oceanirhabdus seepicola TaxID=2828781 RepID=A0A9J6P0F7_9CLOT|nr:serpin family protein [Oceanirhabdus seepicola]MCM1989852.1 hypothetical protein [Oceanirhabdus seepicola]